MPKPWRATVLTLFPEMYPGPLGHSIIGKALKKDLAQIETVNIRDFATDKHKTVDDTPFGGGAGMVMKADVVGAALDSVMHLKGPKIYLSPKGRPFTQDMAKAWSQTEGITLVCGHYEGIDERVIEHYDLEEVSLGDFVLTGGEMAVFPMLDACIRLIPGVIGKAESLTEESFENNLLEYPHYTRPQTWRGMDVPEVLISGHHGAIHAWRLSRCELTTQKKRPDLWSKYKKCGIV